MTDPKISRSARGDIDDILSWTHERFGERVRLGYRDLIVAGLRDIATAPFRPGSVVRADIDPDARFWHLRLSRARLGKRTGVPTARHFLYYRVDGDTSVTLGRVLHEAMDLPARIHERDPWSP